MQELNEYFGKVHLFESDNTFGSAIIYLEPGKEIKNHHHKKMKEVEIILEGEVVCNGKIRKKGDILIWELNQDHNHRNLSNSITKILCITVPPYNPEDEYVEE